MRREIPVLGVVGMAKLIDAQPLPSPAPSRYAPAARSPKPDLAQTASGAQASPTPAPDPALYSEAKNQFDRAAAKGKIADDTMQSLQKGATEIGQPLHPDITSTYESMNRALDAARQALEDRDLAAARENINIANECARRVLKAGGPLRALLDAGLKARRSSLWDQQPS